MFPYSTFLGPLFWMVMGVLAAIFFYSLVQYFKASKMSLVWWKWLLLIFWLIGLYTLISGAFVLIGESEVRAGLYFLGVFGTLIIIFGVALWRLVMQP